MTIHNALHSPVVDAADPQPAGAAHAAPTGLPAPGVLMARRIPAFEPPLDVRHRPAPLGRRTVVPCEAAPLRVLHPVDPAARAAAQRVLQLSLEVLDGRRSPDQLSRLLPARMVEKVRTGARTRTARPGSGAPAILGPVRVQQVTSTVAETFTTVRRGRWVTAAVARMELTAAGWRCTALRLH